MIACWMDGLLRWLILTGTENKILLWSMPMESCYSVLGTGSMAVITRSPSHRQGELNLTETPWGAGDFGSWWKKIMRALSCGEGFSAQNSRMIVVGIGPAEKVDRAVIVWPSGKITETVSIDHSSVLELRE